MGHCKKQSNFTFFDNLGYDIRKHEKFIAAVLVENNDENDESTAEKGQEGTPLTQDSDSSGTPSGDNNHHTTSERVMIKEIFIGYCRFVKYQQLMGK